MNQHVPEHAHVSSDVPEQMRCLLCGSTSLRDIERISVEELVRAYRDQFGIRCEFAGIAHLDYLECVACGLRFFLPAVTGSTEFYGQLQQISWYYAAEKQEFLIAAPYVVPGAAVLEIGAGRGLFAKHIATAGSYAGLEFNPSAIQAAAGAGIRLLAQSVEDHAQGNAARYDAVCTFQVLEHVAEPRSFLDAAVRCLREDGLLIVSVPSEDSFARFAYWDVLNLPPHHVTRWTDNALGAIGRVCGVELVALVHEPLGRNMRRAYSQAVVGQRLAAALGMRVQHLDARLRRPAFRALAGLGAAALRRWLAIAGAGERRGHAVVAVFRKRR